MMEIFFISICGSCHTIDKLNIILTVLEMRAMMIFGKMAITEISQGMAIQLLADSHSKSTLQLAGDIGKTLTEEALKRTPL